MAEDGNNHFGAVDETTKRLVGRCRRVTWLKDNDPTSPETPTTMKQRLLSVSMPSAMESSLSVMEVAAQKSAPGVQTPSRANNWMGGDGTPEVGQPDPGAEAVAVGNEAVSKAMDVEKSPFEVEGEA